VNVNRPNVSQLDRDVIEDLGLTDLDERAATGENAEHNDEPVAS
jgi:hypothetical protein